MSIVGVVSSQFKLILVKQCNSRHGNNIFDVRPEMNSRCIFHLFTAVLGYCLIATVAVGQISLMYKVLRFPNGQDYPRRMDVAALTVTSSSYVAYAVHRNFPVSTWGEGIICLAYYVIIVNLMLLSRGRHRHAVVFMLLYVLVMVLLLWPLVPGYILVGLKILNIPIDSVRKGHRIYLCYKAKGKTQFSTKSAVARANFHSFGRVLTSIADTWDLLMVVSYLLDCIFSVTLTFQTLRYWMKRRKCRASAAG